MKLIYDIKPNKIQPGKMIQVNDINDDQEIKTAMKRSFEAQRIIDLRQDTKDTEFNINDEDLKNGYIGYASWDSKISIPLRS